MRGSQTKAQSAERAAGSGAHGVGRWVEEAREELGLAGWHPDRPRGRHSLSVPVGIPSFGSKGGVAFGVAIGIAFAIALGATRSRVGGDATGGESAGNVSSTEDGGPTQPSNMDESDDEAAGSPPTDPDERDRLDIGDIGVSEAGGYPDIAEIEWIRTRTRVRVRRAWVRGGARARAAERGGGGGRTGGVTATCRPGRAGAAAPATVAGLDVAYAQSGDLLAAAVTVLDARTLTVVDEAVSVGRPAFGYVPGLFAFRELPALLAALDRLTTCPELLVCDGHGLAHPRRFGLACHLGVVTGLPAIGVGKTALVGEWAPPGGRAGCPVAAARRWRGGRAGAADPGRGQAGLR